MSWKDDRPVSIALRGIRIVLGFNYRSLHVSVSLFPDK